MGLVERLRAAGCVFAEEEAALLTGVAAGDALEALVVRRVAGEPLELLLGYAEFCGLRVPTAAGVFVPRQRTALLVRETLARTVPGDPVLDLCCGGGAIGIVLAHHDREVHAADLDPDAVACARRSLERVYEGDLYEPLPHRLRGTLAAVVANAPYVPTGAIADMPPEARDHEHRVALDGGADGTDVQARVAAGVRAWLRPGGVLLIETGRTQVGRTSDLVAGAGLDVEVVTDDAVGATVVLGVVGTLRP